MKYYEVWTIVEPKRKALSQATLEYTAAANKLTALNEKIEVLYTVVTIYQIEHTAFSLKFIYIYQQFCRSERIKIKNQFGKNKIYRH